MLVNSIKYYMSFAMNKEYFSFFKQQITQILISLVIPGLYPSEEDFNVFLFEAEAFK